jgi:hypothetical protein
MKNTFAELAAKHKSIQEQVQHGTSISSLKGEIDTLYAECKAVKYEEGIARCERYHSALLDQEGKIDEAVKLNAKVKRFAKKNGIGDLVRECVFFECVVELRSGDTKPVYKKTHTLYNEAKKEGDTFMVAQSGLLIGIIVKQNGLDDEALQWFKRTMNVTQKQQYLRVHSNILMHLSEMFLTKLQYSYAEKYARENLITSKQIKDDDAVLRATIRLLTVLIENRKLDESTKHLKFVESSKQMLAGPNLGTFYLCSGKLFAKNHKYREAEVEFNTALEIYSSFKRNRLRANTYGILTELYIEQKKVAEALASVGEMVRISESMNESYFTTQSYRLYYQAYKLSGDALNALNYLEKYNERVKKDEEQLLTTRIEFIELQKDYEMKQAEAESERQRSSLLQIELEHKEMHLRSFVTTCARSSVVHLQMTHL